MALVGEEFPLECPACGGDIRPIAFITKRGPSARSSRMIDATVIQVGDHIEQELRRL
jgi:hypothetical protein